VAVTPFPNFFFLENSLFKRKCFSLKLDAFLSEKFEFLKSGGFPVFCPYHYIFTIFEPISTKFLHKV